MKTKALMFAVVLATAASNAWAQEPADSIGDLHGDLDELVITAKKEIVKSDGAQVTYDLEQDDSSKGQSLLDALRKVPTVTVDGQDNIYIKGSGNFRVYVNGKEEPMLTANYQKIFKAMPAEAVSRIEVITEPGAKYDAEGVGGILNLVTERKQTKDGYTANVSLSGGAQQSSASVYGRMKYGKVTADAGVDYADNSLQKQHSYQNEEIENLNSDTDHLQRTRTEQRLRFNYTGARMSLSWEPTDRDLLTYGMNLTSIDGRMLGINTRTSMFDKAGTLQWSTRQEGTGRVANLGSGGNASYRRLLDDRGQSLTAAYRFNFDRMLIDLDYLTGLESGNRPFAPYEKSRSENLQREHTATLDYELPLADGKHKVEAGAKGIFRRNDSDNRNAQGETPENAVLPASDNGAIRQIQDVYAAYASYKGTFGNVTANGGVRYEHTYMGLDFADSQMENFRQHLNDVTPNVSATYMFGPAENLRLAYQMRISRPSVQQLNPAIMRITQTYAQKGNPDLESERTNSVSLSYSNFTPTVGGSLTLSYSQTDNSIATYTYFDGPTLIHTYGNYGRNCRTELSAFLNWNANSKISMSVNGAVNYTDLSARRQRLHNSGWKGNYGANFSYSGPWNMKFSAYGGQSFGHIELQGEFGGWYYYGLSVRKSLLKDDALSLTLNAGNFLTKYTHYKSNTRTADNVYRMSSANRSWNVGLTLSWRFGHLKEEVKSTGANLDNDDAKKAESTGLGI